MERNMGNDMPRCILLECLNARGNSCEKCEGLSGQVHVERRASRYRIDECDWSRPDYPIVVCMLKLGEEVDKDFLREWGQRWGFFEDFAE